MFEWFDFPFIEDLWRAHFPTNINIKRLIKTLHDFFNKCTPMDNEIRVVLRTNAKEYVREDYPKWEIGEEKRSISDFNSKSLCFHRIYLNERHVPEEETQWMEITILSPHQHDIKRFEGCENGRDISPSFFLCKFYLMDINFFFKEELMQKYADQTIAQFFNVMYDMLRKLNPVRITFGNDQWESYKDINAYFGSIEFFLEYVASYKNSTFNNKQKAINFLNNNLTDILCQQSREYWRIRGKTLQDEPDENGSYMSGTVWTDDGGLLIGFGPAGRIIPKYHLDYDELELTEIARERWPTVFEIIAAVMRKEGFLE